VELYLAAELTDTVNYPLKHWVVEGVVEGYKAEIDVSGPKACEVGLNRGDANLPIG